MPVSFFLRPLMYGKIVVEKKMKIFLVVDEASLIRLDAFVEP